MTRVALKNYVSVTILLVVILRLYSQSYRDARHSSVFKSDQETIFYQPDCGPNLFCKTILFHLESLMKVVVLHV